MAPDGSPLEAEGVLNPGVARDRDGRLLMYPRIVAVGNVSRIGIARRGADRDDASWQRLGIVLDPQEPYELRTAGDGHGCEDARVTFIADLDRYVMSYAAFGPQGARIAIAVSLDGYRWTRLGLVGFADAALNAVDNKDAAFFPEAVRSPAGVLAYAFFHRPMRAETIRGQTPIPVMLAPPPQNREAMCVAYVPVDRVKADIANLCAPLESIRVLDVGTAWGQLKNGAGTPPVRTEIGWLSMFHAVDAIGADGARSLLYSAGIVINDLEQPHRIVYRSPEPVLVRETSAERFGTVNDVVFPTGIDPMSENVYDVYYGAADTQTSVARIEVDVLS